MSKEPTERVTVSFPEDEEKLLKAVDAIVEEEEEYEDRTDFFEDAIGDFTGVEFETYFEKRYNLYDAAIKSYLEADRRGLDDIKQNAREHIITEFPDSRMAEYLEQ